MRVLVCSLDLLSAVWAHWLSCLVLAEGNFLKNFLPYCCVHKGLPVSGHAAAAAWRRGLG
eukprot:scaffold304803_cov32-Tisochrysis_lutea.AAC.1